MRKLIFGAANSLDNYIARENEGIDWLLWSDEVSEMMASTWKTVDTMLFGRKTYEMSLAMGGGGPMPGVKSYVFSQTLKEVKGDAVLVTEEAESFIRNLKAQPGKDMIAMCGGDFGRFLLEADLVDIVGLNIHPTLLGSGVPLFRPLKREIKLELTHSRQLKNGCVYLSYHVKC